MSLIILLLMLAIGQAIDTTITYDEGNEIGGPDLWNQFIRKLHHWLFKEEQTSHTQVPNAVPSAATGGGSSSHS